MQPRRQPLAAKVHGIWGNAKHLTADGRWVQAYRSWFPPDAPRQRHRAKRRSAKRERQNAKILVQLPDDSQDSFDSS